MTHFLNKNIGLQENYDFDTIPNEFKIKVPTFDGSDYEERRKIIKILKKKIKQLLELINEIINDIETNTYNKTSNYSH
jgi:pantothenate kinase